MFERLTERARRVVLFACLEAGRLGRGTIETEHLLLGVLREDPGMIGAFLGPDDSIEVMKEQLSQPKIDNESMLKPALDLPLSPECRNVLNFAEQEASSLASSVIDCGHLLLGLLREEQSLASPLLRAHGVDTAAIRSRLTEGKSTLDGFVPNADTAIRIAEAVWLPMFGGELVESEKPFQATLENDAWVVKGAKLRATIGKSDGRIIAAGMRG